MIVAVCCPGPSLLRTYAGFGGDYDTVWAINTAIKVVSADWLSGGDLAVYDLAGDFRPRVGALATPDTVRRLRDRPTWAALALRSWDDVPGIAAQQAAGRPINWSMQAALLHAAHLGARRIDLYGCDLAGVPDCTGYAGEDRTADRWQREARGLSETTQYLAEHGVAVQRIRP